MKTAFVLDASFAASWFLPDEKRRVPEAVFDKLPESQIFVPWIWWFEIRNIFIVNERRGRFSLIETHQSLSALKNLSIEIDSNPDEIQIITLARKHNLSIYDAAYLDLAMRRRIPLASFDNALILAANLNEINTLT